MIFLQKIILEIVWMSVHNAYNKKLKIKKLFISLRDRFWMKFSRSLCQGICSGRIPKTLEFEKYFVMKDRSYMNYSHY